MKRVVITGATSMIGVALIEKCIENQVEVLALVRSGSNKLKRIPESLYVTLRECNLNELAEFENYEGKYDVFYHLGWEHTDKKNRFEPQKQIGNIQYAMDAVALAGRMGCKKFVGAGSQAEYGPVEGVINEETPVNPQIAYGVAKYAAGRYCLTECAKYDLQYVWARIFSVYGPLDNEGTMIRYAVETMKKGESANFSSGEQMWDYLHSDDAGKAMYLLGDCVIEPGVYCVASGDVRPLKTYIEQIQKVIDPHGTVLFGEKKQNDIGIYPDITKLATQTGFEASVDFEEGIKRLAK